MSKVVIIADDLTGANATGVLLARQGFKCATFLNLEDYSQKEKENYNVVSISTDSRGIEKEEAYERVSNVVKCFKKEDISFFSKRIDSTLRGNIGSEIDGVLDFLEEDSIAVVVSSFPASGRITIGGYLMVNSIPLEKTDVAKDPKCPVNTSYVSQIVSKQTKNSVGYISLDYVLQGWKKIRECILNEKSKGNRIVVIDSATNEDIDLIAKACKNIESPIVAVDPGPFTASLAKEMLSEPKVKMGQKVMLTVGSVSNLTRKQLEELKVKYYPLLVTVDSENLIYEETVEAEINRVVNKLIGEMDNYNIVGIITTSSEDEVLDLSEISKQIGVSEEEISIRITKGLAKITKTIMEKTDNLIGGVYTSGGDVTVAVCKELKASGIEVKDEVLPLAVYGRIIKGTYDNMPIITKGGLVGENDALIKCVEYLLTKVSNEYHK